VQPYPPLPGQNCAGEARQPNAAINDRRIKALGTVSAVNIGSMFRNGWDNNIKSADAIPVLEPKKQMGLQPSPCRWHRYDPRHGQRGEP
jgi:hypothetical protein